MNANKARQFIPQLQADVDPENPIGLDSMECALLSHTDGVASLADIQENTQLSLKQVLLTAKSLTKKGWIKLHKQSVPVQPSSTPSTRPIPTQHERPSEHPTQPASQIGHVSIEQKKQLLSDIAQVEKSSNTQRKASIQTGRHRTPERSKQELQRHLADPNQTAAHRSVLRSVHASPLSSEIDKLLGYSDEEQPSVSHHGLPAAPRDTEHAPEVSHDEGFILPPAAEALELESEPTLLGSIQDYILEESLPTFASASSEALDSPSSLSSAHLHAHPSERRVDVLTDPEEISFEGSLSGLHAYTPAPPSHTASLEIELPNIEDEHTYLAPLEALDALAKKRHAPSYPEEQGEISLEAELPLEQGEISLEAELPLEQGEISLEAELPLEFPRHFTPPPASFHRPSFTPSRSSMRTPSAPLTQQIPDDGATEHEIPSISARHKQTPPASLRRQSSDQHLESVLISKEFQNAAQQASSAFDPQNNPHQAVQEMMGSLARVQSSFQLYDPRNRAVKEALAELYGRMSAYLKYHPSITLAVHPWTFKMDAQTVYQNNDRESSLPFKLYRDGVRGLSFNRGFDAHQLAQFLKIITLSQGHAHQNEDDLVTLFWKLDLSHMDMLSVEGIKLQDGDDVRHPLEDLFSRLLDSKKEENAADELENTGFRRVRDAQLLARFIQEEGIQSVTQTLSVQPARFEIIGKDMQKKWAEQLDPSAVIHEMRAFFRYLLPILPHIQDEKEVDSITSWFENYSEHILQRGLLQSLNDLLSVIKKCQQHASTSPTLHAVVEAILRGLQKEHTIRQLLSSFQVEEDEHIPEDLPKLLRRLPFDIQSMLLDFLEHPHKLSTPQALHTARQLLVELQERDASFFIDRISGASGIYCVQLLKCLKEIHTPQAIAAIGEQIYHPESIVQDAVMDMVELLLEHSQRASNVWKVIAKLLHSSDPFERNRAYNAIESSQDPRWAKMLLKSLEERHNELDVDELSAIARLSAKLHPDATFPVVLRLAEPVGRLKIERNGRKMQRFAAIEGLAEIGNLKAEEAVRKWIKSSSGDVKDAFIQAMREIRNIIGVKDDEYVSKSYNKEIQNVVEEAQKAQESSTQDVEPPEDFAELHAKMIEALDRVDAKSTEEMHNILRDDGAKFVSLFHVLARTASLYDANNAIFDRPVEELLTVQKRLFQLVPEIHMFGLEEQFYMNDLRIRMRGANTKQICQELCKQFERIQLGGFIFRKPLSREQWLQLMQLYAGKENEDKAQTWIELMQGIRSIGLEHLIDALPEMTFSYSGEGMGAKNLAQLYAQGIQVCDRTWGQAHAGYPPNPLPIRRFVNDVVDYFYKNPQSNLGLIAFEDPNQPLKTHMLNVTLLSIRIAYTLGLSRFHQADVGVSAFYHDIGHIVPYRESSTAQKALTHQQAAMRFFMNQPGFHESRIRRILSILEHHKDANSTTGQAPHIFSQIIRIADLYDTLTTRSLLGSEPLSPSMAVERLSSCRGRQVDYDVVQAFVNSVGRFPPGSFLELNDGTLALSLGSDGTPERFTRPDIVVLRPGTSRPPKGKELCLQDEGMKALQIRRTPPFPENFAPKQILTKFLYRENPPPRSR